MMDLKPCPFCGREPVSESMGEPDTSPYRNNWQIVCTNADCPAVVACYGTDEADAAAGWNTRQEEK